VRLSFFGAEFCGREKGEREPLIVLGIETSCDETAAAVVSSGDQLLSNVVASQFDVHGKYGGVVPELASREHLRAITPVVREALDLAEVKMEDLDAVAVTYGPGLVGSLLVGLTYAKGLAVGLDIPLLGVNHIEGHIQAVLLEQKQKGNELAFPALALVVSGGHSHLFRMTSPAEGEYRYQMIGKTRDDAAGEAFDKVAKLLGYGYPGGPLIDKLAPYGDASNIRLPGARMKGNRLDLSFSGLKTAVLRHVRAADMADEIETRRKLFMSGPRPTLEQTLEVSPQATLDLIASFQHRVIEELVDRALGAIDDKPIETLIVSGGVAANQGLRKRFESLPYPVYFPTLRLSTDNAGMIAAAAYPRLERGERSDLTLQAKPNLRLA